MVNDTNKELKLFRDLIVRLYETRGVGGEGVGQGKAGEGLFRRHLIISSREYLESLLPDLNRNRVSGDFGNNYLWLKPPAREMRLQPILHLKYDFGRSIPEVRIRLGLFLEHEGKGKAIGFRFEAPEGSGKHHFYHLQIIRGFEKDDDFKPHDCPEWLPCSEPTFPLLAEDSVSLVLCLVASLYGITESVQLLKSMHWQHINEYLQRHPYNPFASLSWYWEVISEKTPSKPHQYYETQTEPEDFEKQARKRHQNHGIRRTTKSVYDSAPSKKRKTWNPK